MPYPLEKLQYGLRRRLRELATRSEANAIQIAAPDFSGFQPIQKDRLLAHAHFKIDQANNLEKLLYPQQPTNLHETPLYIVTDKLTFNNFTPGFKLSTILADFLFAPDSVRFYNCRLDEMFIQSFVNNINNLIEHIQIMPCSFTNENAAKMLCNSPAFRSLETFSVTEPFPSAVWWIEAFVEMKCTSLKEFNVHDAPLSIFEIDREVLLHFIKPQRNDFALTIVMDYDVECHSTTEQRLNYLFEEHFERCADWRFTGPCAPIKKGVFIVFDREEYAHLSRCCVFRDD